MEKPTHRIVRGPFVGREVYFKAPTDVVLVELDTDLGRIDVQISFSNLENIDRDNKIYNEVYIDDAFELYKKFSKIINPESNAELNSQPLAYLLQNLPKPAKPVLHFLFAHFREISRLPRAIAAVFHRQKRYLLKRATEE